MTFNSILYLRRQVTSILRSCFEAVTDWISTVCLRIPKRRKPGLCRKKLGVAPPAMNTMLSPAPPLPSPPVGPIRILMVRILTVWILTVDPDYDVPNYGGSYHSDFGVPPKFEATISMVTPRIHGY